MNIETILIVFGCLILFGLYKIYHKINDFYDEFEAWYSDWQKKFDRHEPKDY